MDLKEMYREIINEHNLHPTHKQPLDNPSLTLRGVNPSCGDEITLEVKMNGNIIEDI